MFGLGNDSLLIIIAVIFLYFVPAIVAYGNQHRNRDAILALTLLAGWTGLGWLIALIWSLTRPASHGHDPEA